MIEKGISRTITFTMRDSTTGQPKTTLVAEDVTVKISKDGADFEATTNAPVAIQDTAVNTGEFALTITAAEINADAIVVKATAAATIEVRTKIATEANYTATKAGYLTGTVALNSTVAKEADLIAIKGSGFLASDSMHDLMEAIKTRLASKGYAGGFPPASVTVTNGTIIEGDVSDIQTINKRYLKIQETGSYFIETTHTGITDIQTDIYIVYRYFGPGSSNHSIELRLWNYITLAWVDVLATTKDLPHGGEVDQYIHFTIPGTPSDYFTGSSPNYTGKMQIEHTSNPNTDHYLWIDVIGFGDVETIYTAPANASIGSILDDIENSTYGLSAMKTLVDIITAYVDTLETALATHEANRGTMQTTLVAEHDATQVLINEKASIQVVSATSGSVVVSAVKAGGTFQFVRGNEISYPYGPLGKDVTGRKIYFAVKKKASDGVYIIGFTDITANLTNATTFTGLIPFTAAMTKDLAAGKYYMSINSYASDDATFVKPLTEATFVLDLVDRIIDNP